VKNETIQRIVDEDTGVARISVQGGWVYLGQGLVAAVAVVGILYDFRAPA